jgi:hypothetical protein
MQAVSHLKHSAWQSKKAVSTEIFAGRDIMQIEMAHFTAVSEEHKVLKARFTKSATTLADGAETKKETVDASKVVAPDAEPNVKKETVDASKTVAPEADPNVKKEPVDASKTVALEADPNVKKEPVDASKTVAPGAEPNVTKVTTDVSVTTSSETEASTKKPAEPTIVASPIAGV